VKRFHFNLRPVAVIRAHHELRARDALAAAVRQFQADAGKLTRVRARKEEFEVALLASRRVRFDPAGEASVLLAYRGVCLEEAAAEQAVAAARAVMAECRAAYIHAHRRLEIVRRLETKARTLHRQAALHAEQVEFDEFAGRAASRKSVPL
jgi:flagellar FliJ protein